MQMKRSIVSMQQSLDHVQLKYSAHGFRSSYI